MFLCLVDTQMESLASYFGLGQQKHRYKLLHGSQNACLFYNQACTDECFSLMDVMNWFIRSLDDVRMNLEVVKHCATVLFLVSNYHVYLF